MPVMRIGTSMSGVVRIQGGPRLWMYEARGAEFLSGALADRHSPTGYVCAMYPCPATGAPASSEHASTDRLNAEDNDHERSHDSADLDRDGSLRIVFAPGHDGGNVRDGRRQHHHHDVPDQRAVERPEKYQNDAQQDLDIDHAHEGGHETARGADGFPGDEGVDQHHERDEAHEEHDVAKSGVGVE